jgi:hypothetical protein
MYNTQNYRAFGLCELSCFLKNTKDGEDGTIGQELPQCQ